mgnify:CR=1 FL=1
MDAPAQSSAARPPFSRGSIIVGALLGFLAVALGAFGAHGLEGRLGPDRLAWFETGVDYHLAHALALILTGFVSGDRPPHRAVRIAGWAFAVGVIVFSGSLYALALTGITGLGMITPFGGVAFLIGWAALMWGVAREDRAGR